MERTEEEVKAAVESMLRVRAVESPPSAQGIRTVWHRGTRGAELVSELDASGRVVRQSLECLGARLAWERERGVDDGAGAPPDPEVLAQAALAVRGYSGQDRLLGHLRDRVISQAGLMPSPVPAAELPLPPPASREEGAGWSLPVRLGVLAFAVTLLTVLGWLLLR